MCPRSVFCFPVWPLLVRQLVRQSDVRVHAKQGAQQDNERAKYAVMKAVQEKVSSFRMFFFQVLVLS